MQLLKERQGGGGAGGGGAGGGGAGGGGEDRSGHSTVLALPKVVEADLQDSYIQPQPATEARRLSYAQESLWFIEQLAGQSALYNIHRATRIEGSLNITALSWSIDQVVMRHESLRTRFVADGGGLGGSHAPGAVQLQVAPVRPVSVSLVPAEGVVGDALDALISKHVHETLDLSSGEPLRVTLLRLGPQSHVLLCVLHHIVGDGWSMSRMAVEIAHFYALATQQAEAGVEPLLPLRLQFTDCAHWQRQRFESGALAGELAFWREHLADLPVLDLPADFPRPAILGPQGAGLRFTVDGQRLVRLKRLAKEQGVTLFVALLTLYKLLLKRLANQDDVVVGSPVAGRGEPEFDEQIGYFVNSVVLRSDLSGEPSFAGALERVKQTTLAALNHQELPFDRLVAELSPERDLSRNPLYQVSFALQSYPDDVVRLPGLSCSRAAIPVATSKFDLSLTFTSSTEQLEGVFEFSTDLFKPSTVARWQRHLLCLMDSALARPDLSVDRLAVLSDEEHELIVHRWNATHAPRVENETLHGLFEASAERTPEAPAALLGSVQLSFGELNQRADQLADRLRAIAVAPEVRVAVCMSRSLELLVALLGVLKAGGAYVPVDPKYPADRLAYMLEDSQSAVVLTDSVSAGLLPPTSVPVLNVQTWAEDAAHSERLSSPATVKVQPDNLAYVIYTSGSTGRPKGVQITHRGICNHMRWLQDALALSASDVFLQKTSISFDASLVEIFAPLAVGARTVLTEGDGERDTHIVAKLLRHHGVTVLQAVPSGLSALLLEPELAACPQLRRVICGGEALDRALAREVQRVLPQAQLGNFYGPTEASIDATWHEVKEIPAGAGHVTIGRPVANASCHILDHHEQAVPVGVAGELCVGGRGLARGYLGRPELDAEKFIPNPFVSGDRLYRTGDRARYLDNGDIELLGRMDDQIKLRGFRIELGEIEAVALAIPGTTRFAALLCKDSAGQPRLTGYVEGTPTLADEVREGLRARLPEHMVPAQLIALAEMPRLPNGKLDRKALPRPEAVVIARAAATAPRSALEAAVLQVWQALMPDADFGVLDNFFELGGHSLLATRMAAQLRASLCREVQLRWLFEHPTVAGLAAAIEQSGGRMEVETDLAALVPAPDSRGVIRAPVSFAQRRMWLLQQRRPKSAAYHMATAYRIEGELDGAALHGALQDLVRAHGAWRTRFDLDGDEPVQVIEPAGSASIRLEELDLSGLPPADVEATLSHELRERLQKPFNLSVAPLVRVLWARLAPRTHVLQLVMHHAVGDDWSLGLILEQLSEGLKARTGRNGITLKERDQQAGCHYAGYAVWERQHGNDQALDASWAYWRDRLANAPPLALPYDKPVPLERTDQGGQCCLPLDDTQLNRLTQFSRAHAVTPAMSLLAALAVQLRAYTGQDDITVGSPVSNRVGAAAERLVGVMLNTVLLRTDVSGNPSFRELLQRVRGGASSAYSHQDLPYDLLVQRLREQRGTGSASEAVGLQVMFNLLGASSRGLVLDGMAVTEQPIERGTAQVDVALQVDLRNRPSIALTYASDVFERATAERWLAAYVHTLDQLMANPDRAIGDTQVPAPSEQALLQSWNSTHKPYNESARAHDAFVQQAQRTSSAVALRDGYNSLSYAQLEERSNQLARLLRCRGAQRGALIGLCVERCADMLVSLLAVLKTGAAYVPLDPAYPPDRLAHMVADAKLALVLTDSKLATLIDWPHAQSVWLDQDGADIEQQAGTALTPDLALDARPLDPAYVIYTSGSTGKPKGVVVPHTAVVNFLASMASEPGLSAADRLVAVTTLSFDIAVLELLLPLSVGAQVVLAPRGVAADGRELRRLLEATDANVMQATPSTWRMLIEAGWQGHASFKALIGGEPLPRDLAAALLARTGSLWNMYGPTETTVWSTCWQVADVEQGVRIGKPINNTSVHILDEQLRPRPIGAIGEIYIGGVGVTSGYLNRPELTAERFVPHGLAAQGSPHLYRTGDLGRWCGDGTLEHLGRADTQVKVRGYRIELGEIESQLATLPGIQTAIVNTHELTPGDVRLVAYVMCVGICPTLNAVREHLAKVLPAHMLPQQVQKIDSIPLLPNGKLDRRALPLPDTSPSSSRPSDEDEAASDEERLMASVWQTVLGLAQPPGVTQNLFDLGAHSLLAVRLARAVEAATGRACSLQNLYRAPTVRGLCIALRGPQQAAQAEVIRLSAEARTDTVFCVCGIHIYKDLADGLADQYAVHGVFLPIEQQLLDAGVHATHWPSVEEMAAQYVAAVVSHQPKGPYRLAGVSFGGVLAFEMAQQLARAGHQVAMVMLLDSMLPGTIQRTGAKGLAGRAWKKLKQLWHGSSAAGDHRPLNGSGLGENSREHNADRARDLELARQREAIYLRAIRQYQPQRYDGAVVLARARDNQLGFGEVIDPTHRWQPYATRLEVTEVAGDHLGLLKAPHVDELASCLKRAMKALT